MKTAAVILNHNDNDNTRRLSAEFESFSVIDRVVVVDNSGEKGIDSLPGRKIRLLNVPNDGYSAGNNRGLALIDSEGGASYVIISNPDIYVSEDAIGACIDFLDRNSEYAAVAPRMCAADGTPHHLAAWRERFFLCDVAYSSGLLSRLIGMYRECYSEDYLCKAVADVDCLAGSFLVIRREALRKVGDFDEKTFLYYEEDILGFKLKRAGYKTALLGNCRFIHSEGNSVNKSMNYLKRYLAMQKSRLYFHRRYLKTSWYLYILLCAATVLGTVEKALKTAYYRIAKD